MYYLYIFNNVRVEKITMSTSLDPKVRETIKATVDFLAENGVEITTLFYQKLFTAHPELKHVFNLSNQQNGEQQQALARAVYGFASNVDNLDVLKGVLERIGHKHVSLNVTADQYAVVGENLLAAIHEIVSEKIDKENADVITDAWEQAYGILANIMIAREAALYDESENQLGGWKGLREFVLIKREDESEAITSFYIQPKDGKELPKFRSGQYISVYLTPEGSEYRQIRQYSLSDSHKEECYRITVKREGLVSQHLHENWKVGESIQVSPPAGEFQLQTEEEKPVVLLSAGVGVTPMISFMNTILERQNSQNITFVQAVKNGQQHPFKAHVNETEKLNEKRLKRIVFYENPLGEDQSGDDYHHQGLLDLDLVEENCKQKDADYYLCGPIPFMSSVHKKLISWGINSNNIHYEVFGADKALY